MKLKSALLAAISLIVPVSAQAQAQNCGNRDVVVEHLTTKYGESRRSIGLAPEGRVVEVFASPATGTWTITITLPNGMTCLIASGQAFEEVNEPIAPAGIRS